MVLYDSIINIRIKIINKCCCSWMDIDYWITRHCLKYFKELNTLQNVQLPSNRSKLHINQMEITLLCLKTQLLTKYILKGHELLLLKYVMHNQVSNKTLFCLRDLERCQKYLDVHLKKNINDVVLILIFRF